MNETKDQQPSQPFGRDVDMNSHIYYFSYGANMGSAGLKFKGVSVLASTQAQLKGYRLVFNHARIGAFVEPAFGNVEPHDGTEMNAHGILHAVAEDEVYLLSRLEPGYQKLTLTVTTYAGVSVPALVYVAEHISDGFPATLTEKMPSERYLRMITSAAVEFELAPDYVAWLKSVEANPIPVPELSEEVLAKARARTFSPEEVDASVADDNAPTMGQICGFVFDTSNPNPMLNKFFGGDLNTKMARRSASGDVSGLDALSPYQQAYVRGFLAEFLRNYPLLGSCQLDLMLARFDSPCADPPGSSPVVGSTSA